MGGEVCKGPHVARGGSQELEGDSQGKLKRKDNSKVRRKAQGARIGRQKG